MRTAPIYVIDKHAYRLEIENERVELWYCLNHQLGYPHASAWAKSRHDWPATEDGAIEAALYADKILRPQDKEND